MNIPFNKPYLSGSELHYIKDAVHKGHISGNGYYTKKCQNFFENNFNVKKALLTTSCTDALEMCAILLNIKEGDEVIMPSFTFVSTANAFVLRGAKIIFADSRIDQPNIDETKIENLITSKTKAIVVVHYAGVACEMDTIMKISEKHNLFVVEDAAQAINSYYKNRPLGSIGHLATFSFHETKNIQCGEGGLLAINDNQFIKRAEIIWEKGTNRAAFFRGEIDKYGWVDIGSSFLPSELNAAFLWAQLESLNFIQKKRLEVYNYYYENFKKNSYIKLPLIPESTTNNAHMFYIICNSLEERAKFIDHMNSNNIKAVFHYQSLHKSSFYKMHNNKSLKYSDYYSENLVRLPLFVDKNFSSQFIVDKVLEFYKR